MSARKVLTHRGDPGQRSAVDKESVVKADNDTRNSANRRSTRKIEYKPRSKDEQAPKKALREKIVVDLVVDDDTIETAGLVTKRTAASKKTKSSESHEKCPSVAAPNTNATTAFDDNGKKAPAPTTREHRRKSRSDASYGRRQLQPVVV